MTRHECWCTVKLAMSRPRVNTKNLWHSDTRWAMPLNDLPRSNLKSLEAPVAIARTSATLLRSFAVQARVSLKGGPEGPRDVPPEAAMPNRATIAGAAPVTDDCDLVAHQHSGITNLRRLCPIFSGAQIHDSRFLEEYELRQRL